MDENDYLTSDELRLLTGRGSSFLQIEMLNKQKYPTALMNMAHLLFDLKKFVNFLKLSNHKVLQKKF
jgi:hypothetical protein